MKIHIPPFVAMAKCNEHLNHGPIDIDLGEDFVMVVRCRDCRCYTPVDEHTGKCVFLIGKHQYVVPDGYCYLGERKEGAV